MRPEVARADRHRAVRDAAAAWRRAGVIGDEALGGILTRYPDDRVRLRGSLRVLTGAFTFLAVLAAVGLGVLLGQEPAVLLAFGAGLVLLTEVLVSIFRRDQGGVEEATALVAVIAVAAGIPFSLHWLGWSADSEAGLHLGLIGGFAVCAVAVRRWAMPAFGALGVVLWIVMLTSAFVDARPWVVATALLAAPLLHRASGAASLTPSERLAADGALAVCLAVLYLAVNVGGYDRKWLDIGFAPETSGPARGAYLVATVVFPLAALWVGIRTRRRVWLVGGVVTACLSLATVHVYVRLGPTWLLLAVAGLVVVGAALAAKRFLDRGPGRERGGFTAEPLLGSPALFPAVEAAATIATLTPDAAPPDERPFRPGGGGFGGGGASETF